MLFSLSGSFPALIPPGPGIWKLNISALQNDDYFDLILPFGVRGNFENPVLFLLLIGGSWENLKLRV